MPDKSSISSIRFHYLKRSDYPRNKRKLAAFLRQLFKKEQTPLRSLTYIFCTDEYLLGINQQFLKHDYYTDIISFNLGDDSDSVDGEIYISLERVADNARRLGQSFQQELHRVIFHGALHLCGYKDKSAKDKATMRKMEDLYLRRYSRLK